MSLELPGFQSSISMTEKQVKNIVLFTDMDGIKVADPTEYKQHQEKVHAQLRRRAENLHYFKHSTTPETSDQHQKKTNTNHPDRQGFKSLISENGAYYSPERTLPPPVFSRRCSWSNSQWEIRQPKVSITPIVLSQLYDDNILPPLQTPPEPPCPHELY